MNTEMRKCSQRKETKNIIEFYKNQWVCKDCERIYNKSEEGKKIKRDYYQRNKLTIAYNRKRRSNKNLDLILNEYIKNLED